MKWTPPDPAVTIAVWEGPLSALAARLNTTPAALLQQLRRRGGRRGADWRLDVHSPVALATARRVLNRDED